MAGLVRKSRFSLPDGWLGAEILLWTCHYESKHAVEGIGSSRRGAPKEIGEARGGGEPWKTYGELLTILGCPWSRFVKEILIVLIRCLDFP